MRDAMSLWEEGGLCNRPLSLIGVEIGGNFAIGIHTWRAVGVWGAGLAVIGVSLAK